MAEIIWLGHASFRIPMHYGAIVGSAADAERFQELIGGGKTGD